MARSPFSLYRRPYCRRPYVYYVQLWNSTLRKYETGISIRTIAEALGLDRKNYSASSRTEVKLIVERWLSSRPSLTIIKVPTFGAYCLAFWDWDNSPYIKAKLLRKQCIGKAYCNTNHSYIERFLISASLGNEQLSSVTPGMLEQLVNKLQQTKGLSSKSLNSILLAMTKPLNEAARLGLIKESPSSKVMKLAHDSKRKGVLSSDELAALFSTPWRNERVRTAAMLSLSCGLRLGEVLALSPHQIGENTLRIDASYSVVEGIKTTKNRQVRIVYLPPELHSRLNTIFAETGENYETFQNMSKNKKLTHKIVESEFYHELERIGIRDIPVKKGEPVIQGSRQERNISFHSLRHLYNTLLRGAIPDATLRESIGHLTASMTDHYDHAEHDVRLAETEAAVRSRILPFILGKTC